MWFTLQQGETWTGLVKNRRHNGDHYWVRANVTPVWQGIPDRLYFGAKYTRTGRDRGQ
jgi:hypothetical protein